METNLKPWYEREEDWILRRSLIFNKNLVRLTFVEIKRLMSLIGEVSKGSNVLDLCCGIGRHSLELARLGYNVTGVDITESYIDIARERALLENLEIEFQVANMKHYVKSESFDLVVNLCTSFGYLDTIEDDLNVLENVYKSLLPNGRFVLEILGKEVIARTFKEFEELDDNGVKVLCHSRIEDNWNKLICRREFLLGDEIKSIEVEHRLFSAKELTIYLSDLGFKNIRVFGDFAGSPYDNKATSMILIAQK
ncbi:class I SAM-dependent methyltransferase [Sphingobacterium siyangense]|uniref:class I SAM-dependent methyltransferase n=1 Tax=Sphingobacterium siyangense TaxID=459529 RepID=UPI0028A28FAA|nr:class I SAM-dependent methyltransferase [Sphingobacterium siyangense]